MLEPLLLVYSYKYSTLRLESGNHRIKVAIERKYTHLPCALLIIQDKWIHSLNGKHFFPYENIFTENLIKSAYPYLLKPINFINNKNIFL